MCHPADPHSDLAFGGSIGPHLHLCCQDIYQGDEYPEMLLSHVRVLSSRLQGGYVQYCNDTDTCSQLSCPLARFGLQYAENIQFHAVSVSRFPRHVQGSWNANNIGTWETGFRVLSASFLPLNSIAF